MNKKIIAAVLTVSSIFMSMTTGVIADDSIKIFVNGNEIDCSEVAPFIENDCTLVPMRAIFEALGVDVEWDEDTKTIISYDPVSDTSIGIQINLPTMFVNGTPVALEAPAKIVNNSTVVPIRAVSESMKSIVDWDGETRTVSVSKALVSKALEN